MSATRYTHRTGVNGGAPPCPLCGRKIGLLFAVTGGFVTRPRHKDPATGGWCRPRGEVRS